MWQRNAFVHLLIVVLVATACFVAAAPASAAWFLPELQLTNDDPYQQFPDVSGTKVVYEDSRNGNLDIYLYDLATKTETRLTTDPSYQRRPAISGDYVVWEDGRNGTSDIYLYDLSTKAERRVSTLGGDQVDPAISGFRVVWQDDSAGNDEIYICDVNANIIRCLTDQSADQQAPAISDRKIVWQDARNGSWDVYLYDLETASLRQLTATAKDEFSPAISGASVAYMVEGSVGIVGSGSVDVCDLESGAVETLGWADDPPDIDGTRVVYGVASGALADPRMDVYYYDLTLHVGQRVTDDGNDASAATVSGSRIAYMRSWFDPFPAPGAGGADVYVTELAVPQLTAVVGAPVVPYEAQASVSGRLLTAVDGEPIGGKAVTLQVSKDGTDWVDDATTLTLATGGYVLQSPALTSSMHLRVRFPGDADYLTTVSAAKRVKPTAHLTKPSAPLKATRGRVFTSAGYLKPRHIAGLRSVKIECFRKVKHGDGSSAWLFWKALPAVASNFSTYSRYSAKLSLPYSGRWRIRAWHPSDGLNASTRTTWREFTVRQHSTR